MKSKNKLNASLSTTKKDVVFDKDWLRDFYSQVGREVSLARESQRETHNWVITLVGGAVAAVWALGGSTFNYPTTSSFIVLLVITPLVFRFFVRSCLEYQIFNRWISLRNTLDIYFFTKENKPETAAIALQSLAEQIQIYYFQWKQPKTNWKMIKDNLQLAYGWPFVLLFILLTWGLIMLPLTGLVLYAILITGSWMVYEVINFSSYFNGRYKKPSVQVDIRLL
jgi:hypothetical protein